MKRGPRILLAVLISPLAVLVPLGFFAAAETLIFPGLDYGLEVWLLVAMFAVPIALVAVGTVGLGAHLIFERLGIVAIWPYVLLGLGISLIPGATILLSGQSGDDRIYPVLFLACAFAASLVFGAVVTASKKRREKIEHNAA